MQLVYRQATKLDATGWLESTPPVDFRDQMKVVDIYV